jgi:sulfur relay (sulfurtransferase) complex TusBCD TusD component (DsrE family)
MKYSIIINPINEKSQASAHAIDFVSAILKKERCFVNVFFYGYAVKQAFFNDQSWNKLVNNRMTLQVCSTVAESYLSRELEIMPHFNLAGLGQWMEALVSSDKRVEFV